jgi:pimeloyl-ACP methyl ester carboxylesterase
MVGDAQDVLDALGLSEAWVAGYGAGAVAALHLAALEPRVAGVAAVAPTTDEPLLARAPGYGLADLLAGVGARPCLVVAPRWDPDAAPGAVVAAARAAGVEHRSVADYHRLSAETREAVADWLGAAGSAPRSQAA